MSAITVYKNTSTSTSPIIWTRMTPWVNSAMNVHIVVPGGRGLGRTYNKGSDNATTTLTGRCPWTSAGQTMFESLAGTRLRISNGIGSTRTGIAGTPVITEQNPAWIFFTISVTEE